MEENKNTDENPVLIFVTENYPEMAQAADAEKFAHAAELLRKQKAFNEAMADIYEREPELADIITAVVQGKGTIGQALSKHISPEELSELYEAEGEDAVKNADERRKAFRAHREQMDKIALNAEQTQQELDAFVAEQQLSDEQTEEFLTFAQTLFGALKDGIITKKEWKMLYDMQNYDANLNAAREEGVTVGRNSKIDARRTEEQARRGTDGLPAVGGAGNMPPEKEGRKLPSMVANMRKMHEQGAI